ncbi:hypothetical protein HUJ04_010595 [Dendroctonus ponderosae]|nr:hypothetical protein HUJ04_010595 [Dendroctonus ponderosae]
MGGKPNPYAHHACLFSPDELHYIRAGDYRYFDQVDKDIDIPLVPPRDIDEEEYDSYDPMPFGEYFGLLLFTNMATVLEVTEIRHRRKTALRNKKVIVGLTSARKALDVIKFLWGAFESVIVSVNGVMDRATRNFRHILMEINKDIVTLKEQTNYKAGVRVGSNKIWYPTGSYKEILNEQRQKGARSRDHMHYSICIKFFLASWYLFMAQSEWFCYLLIILYQTLKGNLISLPMLLMTFCWGALTVPRPTKTFWVVNIACGLAVNHHGRILESSFVNWGSRSPSTIALVRFYPMGIIIVRMERWLLQPPQAANRTSKFFQLQACLFPWEIISQDLFFMVTRIIHDKNQSLDGADDDDVPPDPNKLRNLLLTLRRSKAAWWQLSEECTILDDNYVYYLTNLAHNDWDFLVLYLFNERVFSNAMNFMTQGG